MDVSVTPTTNIIYLWRHQGSQNNASEKQSIFSQICLGNLKNLDIGDAGFVGKDGDRQIPSVRLINSSKLGYEWSSYNTPPTLISGCAFRSRTIFWRFCFGLDMMMRNIKPTGCSSSLCHPLISQSVFASISIQSFEAKGGWWSWKHDDKHQCIIVCTLHIQENSGLKPIALPHMVMRVPRLLHHVGRTPPHLNDVRGF